MLDGLARPRGERQHPAFWFLCRDGPAKGLPGTSMERLRTLPARPDAGGPDLARVRARESATVVERVAA